MSTVATVALVIHCKVNLARDYHFDSIFWGWDEGKTTRTFRETGVGPVSQYETHSWVTGPCITDRPLMYSKVVCVCVCVCVFSLPTDVAALHQPITPSEGGVYICGETKNIYHF